MPDATICSSHLSAFLFYPYNHFGNAKYIMNTSLRHTFLDIQHPSLPRAPLLCWTISSVWHLPLRRSCSCPSYCASRTGICTSHIFPERIASFSLQVVCWSHHGAQLPDSWGKQDCMHGHIAAAPWWPKNVDRNSSSARSEHLQQWSVRNDPKFCCRVWYTWLVWRSRKFRCNCNLCRRTKLHHKLSLPSRSSIWCIGWTQNQTWQHHNHPLCLKSEFAGALIVHRHWRLLVELSAPFDSHGIHWCYLQMKLEFHCQS